MTKKKHVLQILRPPLEHYPPSIYQSNILSESGFRVSALQESKLPGEYVDVGLDPKVERHYAFTSTPSGSFLGRMARVLGYRRKVREFIEKARPDVVIAYDSDVAWAIGRSARRCGAKLVWHFHEIPEHQPRGYTVNHSNRFVWNNPNVPDLIVFPDPGRANVYAAEAGIDAKSIQIVANCPRSGLEIPRPKLRERLSELIPSDARIVLYHGAVGSNHGLETAIRSMPQWPDNVVFVVKGRVRSEYAERLDALAASLGVAKRFILFDPGFQSTKEHLAMIAGADVGWTVLEPVCNAWKYSALASNKRFECMSLGLPQISDDGYLLPELIEVNGCGICIPHDSTDDAEKAVNALLSNNEKYHEFAARARNLYCTVYNYDKQFAPVIEKIRQMLFASGAGR